jgi:DNA-binding NarL/FixJ family response regulator
MNTLSSSNVYEHHRKISVVLLSSYAMLRTGICRLLEPSFIVIGEAWDDSTMRHLISHAIPDVVVAVVGFHPTQVLELVHQLKLQPPHLKSIIVSLDHSAVTVLDAVHHGAHGYISPDEDMQSLTKSIHAVADGAYYFGRSINEAEYTAWLRRISKNSMRSDGEFHG